MDTMFTFQRVFFAKIETCHRLKTFGNHPQTRLSASSEFWSSLEVRPFALRALDPPPCTLGADNTFQMSSPYGLIVLFTKSLTPDLAIR